MAFDWCSEVAKHHTRWNRVLAIWSHSSLLLSAGTPNHLLPDVARGLTQACWLRRASLEDELRWYRAEALRLAQSSEPCGLVHSLDIASQPFVPNIMQAEPFVPNMQAEPFVPNMQAEPLERKEPPSVGSRADCALNSSTPLDVHDVPVCDPPTYKVLTNCAKWKPHLIDMGFSESEVNRAVEECSSLDHAFLLLERSAQNQEHSTIAENTVAEAASIPSFHQIQQEQEQEQSAANVWDKARFKEIQREQQSQKILTAVLNREPVTVEFIGRTATAKPSKKQQRPKKKSFGLQLVDPNLCNEPSEPSEPSSSDFKFIEGCSPLIILKENSRHGTDLFYSQSTVEVNVAEPTAEPTAAEVNDIIKEEGPLKLVDIGAGTESKAGRSAQIVNALVARIQILAQRVGSERRDQIALRACTTHQQPTKALTVLAKTPQSDTKEAPTKQARLAVQTAHDLFCTALGAHPAPEGSDGEAIEMSEFGSSSFGQQLAQMDSTEPLVLDSTHATLLIKKAIGVLTCSQEQQSHAIIAVQLGALYLHYGQRLVEPELGTIDNWLQKDQTTRKELSSRLQSFQSCLRLLQIIDEAITALHMGCEVLSEVAHSFSNAEAEHSVLMAGLAGHALANLAFKKIQLLAELKQIPQASQQIEFATESANKFFQEGLVRLACWLQLVILI